MPSIKDLQTGHHNVCGIQNFKSEISDLMKRNFVHEVSTPEQIINYGKKKRGKCFINPSPSPWCLALEGTYTILLPHSQSKPMNAYSGVPLQSMGLTPR